MPTETAPPAAPLVVKRNPAGRIWSHVRRTWLVETPEERVRQEYLTVLVNEYGYALAQITEEENVTRFRGAGGARADFLLWRTVAAKAAGAPPFVVVECKADYVTIGEDDYRQGENYARIENAPFFVTHNSRETRYWRVLKEKRPGTREEIENIPHAGDTDRAVEAMLARLKTFKEKEFADLLHKCHNVIRNGDHLDPAKAFDEIAKILFVKVVAERELREKQIRDNRFTVARLDQQFGADPLNVLFEQTKRYYKSDRLFPADSQIALNPATGREIVRLLEAYNLSETREDVKGIAFERFLGRTLRGENLGQFFTPRPVVDFMIRMVAPQAGETVCDPACGSGGFLIRFFSLVRDQILDGLRAEYEAYAAAVEADAALSPDEKAARLEAKNAEIRREADQNAVGSRMWTLANRCVYGTDANERAAQMAKMNMIMHGDGHGGVHHHNGFLNVNGIFEERFDLILTNPPFGANVEKSAVVTPGDVAMDADDEARYVRDYGADYAEARAAAVASEGKPIGSLFALGTNEKGQLLKQKTEVLFVERCLSLLKPGGRLGIVLPEGVLNNPSLQYVRDFCEDRARLLAVVSLPQETFLSTGATVKASLVFVRMHTEAEKAAYDATYAKARKEVEKAHAPALAERLAEFDALAAAAKAAGDAEGRKRIAGERAAVERDVAARMAAEARALLKARFPYHVFLYEAEHVGISATGEAAANELFPNAAQPAGTEGATALELYRRFEADPEAFLLGAADEAEAEEIEDEA